jgi:MEMO1 family protein
MSADLSQKSIHHPLIDLARRAVEAHVREGRTAAPPRVLTPEMSERAGVFVCLKKRGQLRGCVGTFEPSQANVAQETIRNAISSATEDWRFPEKVQEWELPELEYTVDVLSSPEPVADTSMLDPERYGVIVQSGRKRGLLLPDLDGVDTVEQQIDICRHKAGIGRNEPIDLYRFEVKRYT